MRGGAGRGWGSCPDADGGGLPQTGALPCPRHVNPCAPTAWASASSGLAAPGARSNQAASHHPAAAAVAVAGRLGGRGARGVQSGRMLSPCDTMRRGEIRILPAVLGVSLLLRGSIHDLGCDFTGTATGFKKHR